MARMSKTPPRRVHALKVRPKKARGPKAVVREVPAFKSALEESEWWDAHELAPDLVESGPKVDAEFRKLLKDRSRPRRK